MRRLPAPSLNVLGHVLAENRRDYQSLGMFTHYVQSQVHVTDDRLRIAVMAHLMEAFLGGFMVPGDLDGNRFEPWNVTSVEAIARIEQGWQEQCRAEPGGFSFPALQDVCWLINTPAGNRAALLWSGQGLLRRLRPWQRRRSFAGAITADPPAV